MSEKIKGQKQIKRRRGIVDTLNYTGQNLNLLLTKDGLQNGFGSTGSTAPADTGSGSTTTPAPGNSCPNPGTAYLTETGNASDAVKRTQTFMVGNAVNPGFIYSLAVYSVTVDVTAVDGDTQDSIASKLADAINATPLSTWNQFGSDSKNYKPTASSSGGMVTVTCDVQHQFAGYGTGSCSAAPPPEPQFPYTQAEIDAMDCQQITTAISDFNSQYGSGSLSASWQTMYDYMAQRQSVACYVAPPPPPDPTEPAFPYTKSQVDGMTCELLQTSIASVEEQISSHGYTTWNDMLQYMKKQSETVCAVAEAPSVPQLTPPQVMPFPIYGMGGGGGGSTGSKAVQPKAIVGKTHFWLAVGVGATIAYFTFGGGTIVKV
jgi:hypothetical protein